MATKRKTSADPAGVLRQSVLDTEKEIGRREQELATLGDQLRPDPNNAELRTRIAQLKREIAPLYDRKAEAARSISMIAGGNQHRVPA